MPNTFKNSTFSACALAVGHALSCGLVNAQTSQQYEIYPLPQEIAYENSNFTISDTVNVVFENGIDKYTKKRLQQLLEKHQIRFTTGQKTQPGKTNILVGINQSGGFVDQYFNKNVRHQESFFENNDSHIVSVDNNVIAVLGDDTDSAFYGLTTLKHVFNQLKGKSIREFRVDDFSHVKHRGFIEGYYGNPWSNEDRAELMRFGGDYKLNTYFFAPKDDVYHNKKWRELYPAKELAEIKKLAQVGNETKNKYVYALHTFMYNAIRFDSEANYQEDLDIIKAKFTQLLKNDVRAFSILADDAGVPPQGPETYVKLLNDLTAWLIDQKKTYPDLVTDIPFCPNDYMGNGSSQQLRVTNKAPESTSIIMTGGRIWGEVSEGFTSNFIKNVASPGHEGRPSYLWINWPCSDNSKQHLIWGGNDTFLHPKVTPANIQGIILNPMQQAEANKFSLFAIADYSWNIWDNKEQADQNWHDSFKYMDHGTYEETQASTALRTIAKHMINQNMDGRVRPLQESLELAPKLKSLLEKLKSGKVNKAETAALIKEFETLQQAAAYYKENPGNARTQQQVIYWLRCWEDTTTAAINYLQCLDAINDGDDDATWNHYSIAHAAFEKSKTHAFRYVNHFEYAEVGVQHIVPFIKALGKHTGGIVADIVDPNKSLKNNASGNGNTTPKTFALTATSSDNIATRMDGRLAHLVDGDTTAGPSFALNPYSGNDRDSTPVDAFVRVDLKQKALIGLVTIHQGAGDKLSKAVLEYSTDGSNWKTLKQFDESNATLQFDASETDIEASSLRLRNLSGTKKWWQVKEFTVAHQKKKALREAFTNTDYKLKSEVSLDQAKLQPAKSIKLKPKQYIGIKLDRIKDLKSIEKQVSNRNLTLQVSRNAVEWKTVKGSDLPDARYIRLINQTRSVQTTAIQKLVVHSNEIQPLRMLKAHAATYKKSKPELVFDGDFNSTFILAGAFSEGNSIVFDLGQQIDIDNLKYVVLDTELDHVRDAKFQLSADGKTWQTAFETARTSDSNQAKPQDNGYTHGSLSNGVIPISHSYLEGKSLKQKARFVRILATKSYHQRWVRIAELLINNGQYIKPINDPTYVTEPIELKNHGPEKMFDGDLTTSYRPDTKGGKIKKGTLLYKLSDSTKIQQINVIQNSNPNSNAVVLVRTGAKKWQKLGKLDKSLNKFKNIQHKHIFEVKIVWQGEAPNIYEIAIAAKQ